MLKVKVFDEEHEKDLEEVVNEFLETIRVRQLIDIKYQVSLAGGKYDEQIYCFSAMIIYKESDS